MVEVVAVRSPPTASAWPCPPSHNGSGPMSAFIQVISRVLQSEERNSFNSWPVQPIVAERVARKYWPHRDW